MCMFVVGHRNGKPKLKTNNGIIPKGKSNQKTPKKVCEKSLFTFKRKKYSKSGVRLPITRAVKEK